MDTIGVSQTDFLSGEISMTFDLEKARAVCKTLPKYMNGACPCKEEAEAAKMLIKALPEIRRLQEFRDRVARILKQPLTDCDDLLILGLDARICQLRRQAAEIERLRAMIDSSEHIREPPKMVGFDMVARIRELEAENVQLLAALDESERVVAHKTKSAAHWYDEHLQARADRVQTRRVVEQQAAEIERLRAEMDNYGDDFVCQMKSKDARIKEIESSLDEAEALTKKNADLMNIYLARIAELEDALVEGLTNFLHYRASCYDPARRCPYAKECDDCSTWDACGHVEKFRSEARQRLQAEGKIGPDAKPRSWQITEERKDALQEALYAAEDSALGNEEYWQETLDAIRAMLQEAGQ